MRFLFAQSLPSGLNPRKTNSARFRKFAPLTSLFLDRRQNSLAGGIILAGVGAVLCLCGASSADAASATWTSTSGGAFATGTNWSTGTAPGANVTVTTVVSNADTATFNLAAGGTIAVDTSRNLANFNFDTAVGSYTFTGGAFFLSSGGITQLTAAVTSTGQTETFSTPITIEGTGGYTIANNATTTDLFSIGNITNNRGANGTAVLTLSGTNTGANTVTGVISDSAATATYLTGVTKSGAGSWTLSGNNTYTGGTTISGGTLTLSGTNAFGAGTITGTGGTLNLSGATTTTGVTTLTGTAMNVTGGSAFSGATAINSGSTLTFGGANGANSGAATYTINAGGTLVADNTGTGANNNARIADTSGITLAGGNFTYKGADAAGTNSTETVGAVTEGGGNSTFTIAAGGSNTAVVTAASFARSNGSGNGATLVNGVGLGSSTTAANRFISTALPTLTGGTTPTNAINATVKNTKIVPYLLGEATAASGGLSTAAGTANTFVTYAATSGFRPLNLTDEFTNNAITAATNTYLTAATTSTATVALNSLIINGPTLTINDGTTLTNTSGALLFSGNGSIVPSTSTGIYGAGAENEITVDSGVTGTISAIVGGTQALTKNGAGTLVLSSANTYTGATYINGGTVQLGNNTALGSTTASLTIRNSSVLDLHDSNITNGNTFLSTNATITNNGIGTATLTINAPSVHDSININGAITDGTGKVAVVYNENASNTGGFPDIVASGGAAPSTYSGGTSDYGSHALRYFANSAFGTGTVTLYQGANVDANVGAVNIPNDIVFANTNSLNPTLASPTPTATSFTSDNGLVNTPTVFSGAISGAGLVNLGGNASTTFSGSMSGFTGTMSITGAQKVNFQQTNANASGVYVFDASNGNYASSSGTLASTSVAGTSSVNTATTVLLGSYSYTGTATNTALSDNTANNVATFQVGALGTASNIAGIIANGTGTTALTLQGGTASGTTSPTLTLTGTNTYTGGTTVNSGTLLVNNTFTTATQSGTGTGAVNVNAGTLGGNGQIVTAGLLTVTAGGTLSPGAVDTAGTIGTLTVRAGVALNGTYTVDLGSTSGSMDETVVVGALTLNSTTSMLNVRSLASNPTIGSQFDILDGTTLTGTFAGLANGSIYTDSNGDSFTVNYTSNDVFLTLDSITAVPEPSTWVGCVVLMGFIGCRYRRSLRQTAHRIA